MILSSYSTRSVVSYRTSTYRGIGESARICRITCARAGLSFLPLFFSSPASLLTTPDSILLTYLVPVFETASGLDPSRPAFALRRALFMAVANGETQEALSSGPRVPQSARPRVGRSCGATERTMKLSQPIAHQS